MHLRRALALENQNRLGIPQLKLLLLENVITGRQYTRTLISPSILRDLFAEPPKVAYVDLEHIERDYHRELQTANMPSLSYRTTRVRGHRRLEGQPSI